MEGLKNVNGIVVFWITDDMISELCASPQLPVGRIRCCWSGWWLGPLAVGRVGGWVALLIEVGGFTFLVL